jgi:hypothetical protein
MLITPFMKRKILHLVVGFLFLGTTASAQVGHLWSKSVGGTGNDGCQAIGYDNSNNVYTAGYYSGTIDADPGAGTTNLTSAGNYDIVISKFDVNGNLVWAKSFGGSGNDVAFSMAVTGAGELYITGYFSGTADFDPSAGVYNLTAIGATETFILKMNSTGVSLWAKQFNGSVQGYDIQVDGYGQLYLTGYFGGTCDFNPGASINNLTTGSNQSGYIVRLDTSGNYQWARMLYCANAASSSKCFALTLDGVLNPNIYVVGGYIGTNDFDVGAGNLNATAQGGSDAFVLKLDFSGNTIWAKTFGSTSTVLEERALGVTLDPSGNVYTTGQYWGMVDFDPSSSTYNLTSTAGNYDAFVQKMDASGNFVGAVSIGDVGFDAGIDIDADANNDIFIVGTYGASMDADPGAGVSTLAHAGSDDVFVEKLSGSLAFQWALPLGGSGQDYINDIDMNSTNIYIAGYYNNTVDINLSSTGVNSVSSNGGSRDQFIGKYAPCTLPGVISSITGPTTVCENAPFSLTAASSFWATSYTWSIPGGWTGTSNTSTLNLTPNSSSGIVYVNGQNNCGTGPVQSVSIAVSNIPATPAISGANTACAGQSYVYSVTPDPLATSYNWTFPAGWSGSSTTDNISLTANGIGGNVEVSASNSCGSSSPASIAVTGNAIPQSPSFSTGSNTMCSGETAIFELIPVGNAIDYSWTLPVGWSGNSTSTVITLTTGNVSGNVEVTANNVCGSSSPSTFPVTVNIVPTVTSTNLTVCAGSPAELEASTDYGLISWYTENAGGVSIGSGPNFISSPLFSDTSFFAESNHLGCISYPRLEVFVTVNPMPTTSITVNGASLLSDEANAMLYQWLDCTNGYAPINGANSQSFTPTQNGTYAVEINLNGCVDTSDCQIVNTIGLKEVNEQTLLIYPNPSSESLHIAYEKGIALVELYTLAGELLLSESFTGVQKVELAPSLNPGIYLVRVLDSNGNQHNVQWIRM